MTHRAIAVRQAVIPDIDRIAAMCALLWPDASAEEHRGEVESLLRTSMCGTLPATIFVAHEEDGALTGFLQAGLRSHADGCDPAHPVGFIEGWSRSHGCTEIASDTWIDQTLSQKAHETLGFEIVDRCIHFRKPL